MTWADALRPPFPPDIDTNAQLQRIAGELLALACRLDEVANVKARCETCSDAVHTSSTSHMTLGSAASLAVHGV